MIQQAVREQKSVNLRKRLYRIALTFNSLHTFDYRQEWMCPECNMIHKRDGLSILSGYQYPACCSFPAGHRLYNDHATRSGA